MALLTWRRAYETGISEIDHQHRKLFEYINKFYSQLTSKELKLNLEELLDNAIAYADYHFEYEEKLMKTFNYPDIEKHQKKHKLFTKNILNYKEMMLHGEIEFSVPVTTLLRDWWNTHILYEDMKYASVILQKRPDQ